MPLKVVKHLFMQCVHAGHERFSQHDRLQASKGRFKGRMSGAIPAHVLIDVFSIGSAYLRIARAFFTGSPAVKRASASGASCTQIRIHGVQGDMPLCRRPIQVYAQLFLLHDFQLPLTSMTAVCVYRGTQDFLASEDAMRTWGGASAEGATTHAAAARLIANFRSVSPKVLACGGQALVSII